MVLECDLNDFSNGRVDIKNGMIGGTLEKEKKLDLDTIFFDNFWTH